MNPQTPNRSPVALAGIFAAVAVLFGFSGQFLPLFFNIVAPLPAALSAIMLPLGAAALSQVAAVLILGMFTGPLGALSFLFQSVLAGLVCGLLVRKKRRYSVIFIGTLLAQILGIAAFLLVQLALMGFDVQAFTQSFTSMADNFLDMAAESGVYDTLAETSGISAVAAEEMLRQTIRTFLMLLPAIYTLMFAIIVGGMLMLLYMLCLRMKLDTFDPPRWRSIIMPPAVVAIFIAGWIVLLFEHYFDNQVLWTCAANVMVIGAACMALDGFSYMLARLRLSERTVMWQMLICMFFVLFWEYLIVAFAIIGVFDGIMDYRHLRTTKGAK